jgi:signal transduction histidine kinase
MNSNPPWALTIHLAVVLAAVATVGSSLMLRPRRLHGVIDRIFWSVPAAWVLAALGSLLVSQFAVQMQGPWLVLLAYHALCVATAIFLLACLDLSRSIFGWWITVYALLGAMGLGYGLVADQAESTLVTIWSVLSVLSMFVLLTGLVLKLKNDAGTATFLVAVAGLWALALVVEDLLLTNRGSLQTPAFRVGHFFFFAFLTLLWLVLTGRVKWARLLEDTVHHGHTQRASIASLSSFDLSTDMHSTRTHLSEDANMAVAEERRRISQDIHDGVGTQLVALLGSLDANSALHRRMRVGLECCLLDLKTTVDNIDTSDLNIFDALGSLRYRIAPALQRANIRMIWKVDLAVPLMAISPNDVAQVQRIAQECFANVLIHSEATKVRLMCRHETEPTSRMLLEVQDDGIGFAAGQQQEYEGKGLTGMRERARSIGAELHIGTKVGGGTRVRLYLPLR